MSSPPPITQTPMAPYYLWNQKHFLSSKALHNLDLSYLFRLITHYSSSWTLEFSYTGLLDILHTLYSVTSMLLHWLSSISGRLFPHCNLSESLVSFKAGVISHLSLHSQLLAYSTCLINSLLNYRELSLNTTFCIYIFLITSTAVSVLLPQLPCIICTELHMNT